MALIAALIALFAGWMLLGWLVSEHWDIVWMRRWCAAIFVITAILISAVGGSAVTAVVLRQRHRAEVRQFAESMESLLRQGEHEKVLVGLRSVIAPPEDADESGRDVLQRMSATSARLKEPQIPEKKSTQAVVPRPRLL